MSKKFIALIALSALALISFSMATALAATKNTLIKGSGPAVFYVDTSGVRHLFPNWSTFRSWYPDKYSIKQVSSQELASLPLGGNVTYRPGSVLVKIDGEAAIYAVARFGVLRRLVNAPTASSIFGNSWGRRIVIVPNSVFTDYRIGAPVTSRLDYDLRQEQSAARTVGDNFMTRMTGDDAWMTAEERRRAMQITSIFENGSPNLDYAAIEDIGDGRGYTAGIIGFTTATGDADTVVERYAELVPNNGLAKYIPKLKQLSDQENPDTSGLPGFVAAWKEAAKDPAFRQAQDEVAYETYYLPAMRHADNLGIKLPLTKAALYDAIVQHGDGTSPDSFMALVNRANQLAGGSPRQGVDEKKWLQAFIQSRKNVLLSATNAATRAAWAESAPRVDIYSILAQQGNYDLQGPIIVNHDVYHGNIV